MRRAGRWSLSHKLLRLKAEPLLTRFVARQLSTAHWFDLTAARRDLGYQPTVSLDEGMRRLSVVAAERLRRGSHMIEFGDKMPQGFALSPACLDVWLVPTSISAERLAYFHSLISDEERERIGRLRIPAKRDEAVISRGALRQILGLLLDTDPTMLAFGTGPFGKPYLEQDLNSRVRFNLSHTAGQVMLAMTLDHEIGADIERIRTDMAHEDLARRFFTTGEYAAIATASAVDRPRAFFRCWCRKEAVLKAMGQGISAGLHSFDVPVDAVAESFHVSRQDFAGETRWLLHDIDLSDPYVACVAVESCEATVRKWDFPWQC